MFSELRYQLRALLRRRAVEAELAEEIEDHLEHQAAAYRATGLPPGEARRRAVVDFGGTELAKEECREERGVMMLENTLQDIRYAARSLMRAPSFTLAAILALGLGIGSATAVFSLLQSVVLRPLPYQDPDRLMMLWETDQAKGLDHDLLSPVNFLDYHALTGDFQDIAGWWRPQLNLVDATTGDPIRVAAVETSQNLFNILGVQPYVGRGFGNDSTFVGGDAEAVISYSLWQSRFNGNRDVIGRSLRLNGQDYTVVGVMPRGFGFPGETEVWQGLTWNFAQHSRGAHFVEAVGRLRPGITPEQVNRDLAALGTRLGGQFPATNGARAARVIPLDREITGTFRPGLFALFAASGLLLLITCINVANLLLARAAGRSREVALRSAIGASGSRLVRLFLTESVLLSLLGAALGVLVAFATVKGFLAWSPIRIPRTEQTGVNAGVLLFTTAVSLITAIAFGLAPAPMISRSKLQDALKDGARGTGSRSRGSRRALVVAEVALAVVLLSGSGLLIKSVARLLNESAGIDPASTITADMQLAGNTYRDLAAVDLFYTNLTSALRARPEIAAAGITDFLPLEVGWRQPFTIVGGEAVAASDAPQAQFHSVDEGYFSALRIGIVRGRGFDAHDRADATPVAIVNQVLADRLWPGKDPVGQHIVTTVRQFGPLGRRIVTGDDHQIVGVVNNVKNSSLRTAAEPAIYFVQHQFPFRNMHIILRGRSQPAQLAALLREEVRKLDPGLPVANVKLMERVLAESADPPRFVMLLMSAFAVLALLLAAIGIYGILSYSVAHRRREIGVRMALGALPGDVLRMVLSEGMALALIGSLIGVFGAYAGGRAVSGLLYQVKPWDPITLGLVVALVLAVASLASFAPGRRASSADPAAALRADN